MQLFNRHVSARGLTVFGFETLLISGSILIAAQVHDSLTAAVGAMWKIVLAAAVCELCFYYNDLYDLTLVHAKRELLLRILQAAGAAAMVLAVVTVLVPSLIIGQGVLLTSLGLVLIAVPLWRLAFNELARDPHLEERVLILGSGPTAQMVGRQIRKQHEFAYRIVGTVCERPDADAAEIEGPILHSSRPAGDRTECRLAGVGR